MTSNNEIKVASLGMERRNLVNKINLLDEKEFIALNEKIKSGFEDVEKKYNELDKVASPVVEDEYLWGLIKSTNVEKSLEGLLETIQKLAECTLGAFRTNGENLNAILNLMKISVSIENDLYRQLEDSDCSKENIANLLHDLCSQYNIDSRAIEGLFEQSFNRTVTLRTRIKDLREEIFKRISKYEEQFEHLDEIIQKKEYEFTYSFDCKTAEYEKRLEFSIKECLTTIDRYKNKLNAVRNSYKQEIDSTKNFLMDSIKRYNDEVSKRHNVKFEEYEKENAELKIQIDIQNQNISKFQARLTWSFVVSIIATIIAVMGLIW